MSHPLRKLESVRSTCSLLLKNHEKLQNFDLNLNKIDSIVTVILDLIKRDYKSVDDIKMHSRSRHMDLSKIIPTWNLDPINLAIRLMDLIVVSVLLDAGAGDKWSYKGISRSEGLAAAALDLFLAGGFSSAKNLECDSVGLSSIQIQDLKTAFLVTDDNPLVGVEGRCRLLQSLGKVLEANPKFFLYDGVSRPGNLIYYLINHPDTVKSGEMYETSIDTLWTVVIDGFAGVWPETRTIVDGVSLGDVWPCKAMLSIEKDLGLPSSGLVCFHKLSQWLTYSLMEPLLGHIKFTSKSKLTGLAEYRNGGLFIDYGVLVPKVPFQPPYNVYDDLVVEWRALTVALLDLVGQQVRLKLGKTEEEFPLVVCLEAGTWKAGREIAKKLRSGMGPPFAIISDGTVF